VGAVLYFALAFWLNTTLMGVSWRTVKYVQPDWSGRRGPKLYPSILYIVGLVDDDGTPLQVEKNEDGEPVNEEPYYVPYEEEESGEDVGI